MTRTLLFSFQNIGLNRMFLVLLNRKYLLRCSSNVSSVLKLSTGDQVTIVRTITKEDVECFSVLSGDTNPIHSSDNQEKAIVHGAFLNSIVSGVIGTKLPGPGSLVVQQTLNFPNKCYVGDTIVVNVKLTENRKILKIDFKCDIKERNETVLFGTAKLLMSNKFNQKYLQL